MSGLDKLSEPLLGRPVLYWAVSAMRAAQSVRGVVLVVAADRLASWADVPWVRDSGVRLVAGGPRRRDSVAAGVDASDAEVVLVHDGARPFVHPEVVDAVAHAARSHGAAIPVLAVRDSLKRRSPIGAAVSVERDGLFRAQTPQGARRTLFVEAFSRVDEGRELTDDAALLEASGVSVTMVEGDPTNLKLTEPADLEVARALAAQRMGMARQGIATDSHPFGPADGLRLGGLEIPASPRLFGHSDGDVVLHAIADALLGAAGRPDLGRMYPGGDAATNGIASTDLLRAVLARIGEGGWVPQSIDVSVLAARPRLGGGRLDEMRASIAGLTGLGIDAVSVKASTGNLSGPEGAGRAISATALVTLGRPIP